jgi:hypothetical protein
MMRIAKIADEDGGGDEIGADTGGSLSARAAGAGGGGFESGRGGAATGRGGVATAFSGLSAGIGRGTMTSPERGSTGSDGEREGSEGERASVGSDGERARVGSDGERTSVGSDGERLVAGAAGSSLSSAVSDGFERRRGMGGGELRGGAAPGTGGSTGTSSPLPASLEPLALASLFARASSAE